MSLKCCFSLLEEEGTQQVELLLVQGFAIQEMEGLGFESRLMLTSVCIWITQEP